MVAETFPFSVMAKEGVLEQVGRAPQSETGDCFNEEVMLIKDQEYFSVQIHISNDLLIY